MAIAWTALILIVQFYQVSCSTVQSVDKSFGIYGQIQSVEQRTSAARLLTQCYAGFALNNCQDMNITAGYPRDYAFSQQFLDPKLNIHSYCLQCCTKPVPRHTGADETWNLTCPLSDLQRRSVSRGERVFRFARRLTLDDMNIVECTMPNRTLATYLAGYVLTLYIVEQSSSYGTRYWRSVLNCTVTIMEVQDPPTEFNEVLHLRSIFVAVQRDNTVSYVLLSILFMMSTVFAVPMYKGMYRGERCCHCASWLVIVNELCLLCIIISCKWSSPPPKIYLESQSTSSTSTVSINESKSTN